MDKETQTMLCERVDGNIGDYLAKLRSLHAAQLALQQEIREQERRVEYAQHQVRDLMIPAPPSTCLCRSHGDHPSPRHLQ